MTDNEIIKALECLSGNRAERGDTECAQCCFNGAYCVIDVAENALELINRQKAEIDILIRKKESLRDEISDLKAEIERLKKEVEVKSQKRANFFEIIDAHEKGRTRAITEFAERLKADFEPETNYGVVANMAIKLFRNTIDNLVEEMTEQ